MQSHEIKLAKKHRENRVYLQNLANFINTSPKFKQLSQAEQQAIIEQADAMCDLDRALSRRMELLGLPV